MGVQTQLSEIRISLGGSALCAKNETCSFEPESNIEYKTQDELMKKKQKTMALLLALVLPVSLLAQNGVFQRGDMGGQNGASNQSMLHRDSETSTSLSNQTFGNPNGADLTNQTFGAPLGSGLLIMLMAGAGYFTMKSNKKNNENQQ